MSISLFGIRHIKSESFTRIKPSKISIMPFCLFLCLFIEDSLGRLPILVFFGILICSSFSRLNFFFAIFSCLLRQHTCLFTILFCVWCANWLHYFLTKEPPKYKPIIADTKLVSNGVIIIPLASIGTHFIISLPSKNKNPGLNCV